MWIGVDNKSINFTDSICHPAGFLVHGKILLGNFGSWDQKILTQTEKFEIWKKTEEGIQEPSQTWTSGSTKKKENEERCLHLAPQLRTRTYAQNPKNWTFLYIRKRTQIILLHVLCVLISMLWITWNSDELHKILKIFHSLRRTTARADINNFRQRRIRESTTVSFNDLHNSLLIVRRSSEYRVTLLQWVTTRSYLQGLFFPLTGTS